MRNFTIKQVLLIAVVMFTAAQIFAKEGIEFYDGKWDAVKAEAKKQNKPIFMDAYASWCGPCRLMAHSVFRNKKVGEFYNKGFVNYKLDMEKGEGIELAKKFDVKYYPTYLYFTPDGELVHREIGRMSEDEFIKAGETALTPNKRLSTLIDKFNKGERDTAFLYELIVKTKDIDSVTNQKALQAFWQKQKPEDLLRRNNWIIFQDYNTDITTANYKYVYDNRQKFASAFGQQEVDEVLYVKAVEAIREAGRNKDEKLFTQAKQITSTSNDKDIQREAAIAELDYYKNKKDWDKFKKQAVSFADTHAKDDADALNFISREFYLNLDDAAALKQAETWIKKSISMEKEYANMETYANILYAQKRPAEAEKVANEALDLAKKTGHVCGQECNGTEDLRKRVEANKSGKK